MYFYVPVLVPNRPYIFVFEKKTDSLFHGNVSRVRFSVLVHVFNLKRRRCDIRVLSRLYHKAVAHRVFVRGFHVKSQLHRTVLGNHALLILQGQGHVVFQQFLWIPAFHLGAWLQGQFHRSRRDGTFYVGEDIPVPFEPFGQILQIHQVHHAVSV